MRLKPVVRRLAQMPLFTIVAVGTLAIGIGANAAIFSVVNGVLLKPLPFPRAEELVAVDHTAPGVHIASAGAAPFQYFTYREDGRVFQDVSLWRSDTMSVTGLAEPEEVPSLHVTDGFLGILGVAPMLGRGFTKGDDSPAGARTVILMAGYWRARFGGDPSAIGRQIVLDGVPRDIIGVLPDSFRFLDRKPSLLLPLRLDRSKIYLGNFSFNMLARLKPGATIDQANADVARMIPISLTRFPAFPGFSAKMFEEARLGPRAVALKTDFVGDISGTLWVLTATIGMVLLIACANVANLLLVRAESRQQELAIRAALGAGWGQIARELLAESLTLGLLGGALGLALASAALRLLVALDPGTLPRLAEISIDARVLLFTLTASLVSSLLFGAIPILKYAAPEVAATLRGGGRGASASRERHRARNTLVVTQVALALVLLVSSGLMIRTSQALRRVNPGIVRPDELLTLRISIPESQVKEEVGVVRMQQAIADRIAALPGVTAVALSSIVPMDASGGRHDAMFTEDKIAQPDQIPPIRNYKFASPGLAATMGNAIVAGRDFTWTDVYDRRPVAMVSENLARELWQEPRAALGKRVRDTLKSDWREVVGVVSDERDEGVNKKAPAIVFWPHLMTNFSGEATFVERSMAFMIRSPRAGSHALTEEVSRAVWAVNPNLPLASVRTVREVYDRSLARTSFTLIMLTIAGAMALLLGVAGIYGVISYSVSQRTREIGIRIALGARHRAVVSMFVRQGVTLAGIGVASGVVAAAALMRLMASLLFDVSPFDPGTYAVVAVSLVAAAVLASAIPAWRTTGVDPAEALRSE